LNLRFERLNMKTSRMWKVKFWKNKLYSTVNLKENVKIVVKLGTSSIARIVRNTMVEITETDSEQIFDCTVAKKGRPRQ
jgi:flagellar biosynthesis protein FlhB